VEVAAGPAPEILSRVNAYLSRKGLMLKRGSIVDATIIAGPSSTKNAEGERDPEMHQTKKGNQWHFGMKAHIGVDADSGLVHTVTTTPANEADVEVVDELLHGKEVVVHADSGYTGADKSAPSSSTTSHPASSSGTSSGTATSSGATYVGPRGGCYRISKNGKKYYVPC